jgi:hypothetical protein
MEQSDQQPHDAGPALKDHVEELQGHFPNDATMQDALSRLTLLGFDRADFSVPEPDPAVATPEQGADAAPTHVDNTQLRTMASGMTGSAAGMALGALAATGVVAIPVVAAAAGVGALGAAAATTGVGVTAEQAGAAARDRLGAEGKLVLAVRIRDAAHLGAAEAAMREAGATGITRVERVDEALTRGVSASSWTGD